MKTGFARNVYPVRVSTRIKSLAREWHNKNARIKNFAIIHNNSSECDKRPRISENTCEIPKHWRK